MSSFLNRTLGVILCISLFCFFGCGDDDGTGADQEITYTVSVSGMTAVAENDPGTGFKISLDKANQEGSGITVAYQVSGTATAGSDYQALPGSIIIADGDLEVTVDIPFIDDTDVEEDETIIITLSSQNLPANVSIAGAPLTITISDNDVAETCTHDNSISTADRGCDLMSPVANQYSENVNPNGEREILTNGVPNHDYANQLSGQGVNLNTEAKEYNVDATPSKAANITLITNNGRPRYRTGVGLNGVAIDPAPAEPFIFSNPNTGEFNWDWVFEPNNNTDDVRLDCAYAHVQPDGTYHYHGNMVEYADVLLAGLGSGGTVPAEPVQIGWAADGFPILYKFGPSETGTSIVELTPSYRLKTGERPGDGVTAPCGEYNGKYINDYEYASGTGDLDECNGIDRSVTLGAQVFEYFYVVTDAFPIVPRCFAGTPNATFRLGP